ncbi:MAG: TIGR04076 family protein [Dehalococcoidia bacterium]|nr:TIGR04076 family protein [Dehalococcoidia bacterium]
MSDVIAKVISQRGTCTAHHRIGDEFVIGQRTPPNLCSWAFYAMFPFAQVLQFGGSFPWEQDPSKAIVACPDAENPVVFELRRDSSR